MQQALTIASLLIAASAFVLAVLTYRRAGRWRQTEDEKQAWAGLQATLKGLDERVTKAERWHDTEKATAFDGRLKVLEGSASITELKLVGLPTQADIAGLRAEVREVATMVSYADKNSERAERAVERAEKAIERIESYLLERNR